MFTPMILMMFAITNIMGYVAMSFFKKATTPIATGMIVFNIVFTVLILNVV